MAHACLGWEFRQAGVDEPVERGYCRNSSSTRRQEWRTLSFLTCRSRDLIRDISSKA